MSWTDDPVRDAELHMELQEAYERAHRKGRCAHCRTYIHDYDDHYDFDGELVCDECLIDWAREYRQEGI